MGNIFKDIELLLSNSYIRWKCCGWPIYYCLEYSLASALSKIGITYKVRDYSKILNQRFQNKWLLKGRYFDFKGIFFPDVSYDQNLVSILRYCFDDVLVPYVYYNDRYDSHLMKKLDACLVEGCYGYVDGAFDVRINEGDVVFDVGAWGGDFSAYCSRKNASKIYAFEPCCDMLDILKETAKLNTNIVPVPYALGEKNEQMSISVEPGGLGNSFKRVVSDRSETICVKTIDSFVQENSIAKLDFIKADIEGAEREMLKGAVNTLRNLAPKLAVCTYHLPDDPEVLSQIIKDANPNYTIVQMRHKLFASVID